MKSFSKLFLIFLLVTVLVNCSSPSDSNNDELSIGEFNSQTAGVIEDNFSGDATFTMRTVGLDEKQYLQLDLKAGKMPFVPDDVSNTYGIFLSVPWNSDGALTLEKTNSGSLYISPNSFFPYFPYILTSGKIIITSQSEDLLTGEINISETFPTPDSGSVEIKGVFKAVRSE